LEELWAQQEEYESDIRERDEVCVCAMPFVGGFAIFLSRLALAKSESEAVLGLIGKGWSKSDHFS
jgi:hypothetical protein